MKFNIRNVGVVFAILMTANCGRLDELREAQDFAASAAAAQDVNERVLGNATIGIDPLPGTAFDMVPTSGSATFSGSVTIAAVDLADTSTRFGIVGRSVVNVDFDQNGGNITGTLDRFYSGNQSDGLLDISGRMTLESGTIGEQSPNMFTMDYVGDITVDGTNYTTSGDMAGRFRGTRPNPSPDQSTIRALSAIDEDFQLHGNNTVLTGVISVVAEN